MSTLPNKPPPPAEAARPEEDADFADEAAPKETEFKHEKDAKELTRGGFDLIS